MAPGWESILFPPENVDGRRRLFRWDRIQLLLHASLVATSLYFGWWQLIVLVTMGSFYGNWLFLLCNSSQHIGLTDEVSAQKAFKEKFNLPFTLVADTKAKLVDGFGVPRNGDFARRQAFLVQDGKVVWRDLQATPTTQSEDALAALAVLSSSG